MKGLVEWGPKKGFLGIQYFYGVGAPWKGRGIQNMQTAQLSSADTVALNSKTILTQF